MPHDSATTPLRGRQVRGSLPEVNLGHQTNFLWGVTRDILYGGGKRLLVANRDLCGEYDRLRSEAEFCDAVVVPGSLLLLLVLMNLQFSPYVEVLVFGGAVVLFAFLFHAARALDREALSMYAHAVADGVVSTQTLDVNRQASNHYYL